MYSEEAFSKVCARHAGGVIPWEHHIRITYYADCRCPVEACPATKYFKTADSFMSHWQVFHTPQVSLIITLWLLAVFILFVCLAKLSEVKEYAYMDCCMLI